MRIFTNGELTVLRTKTHVYRWLRAKGQPGAVKVEKRDGRATDYYDDGLVLLTPSGEDLATAFVDHFDDKTVLDGAVLDEERLALLHGDQKLTWGPVPLGGQWSNEVQLADHRSDFPTWAPKIDLGPRAPREDLDEDEQAYEQELDVKLAAGFPHGTLIANEHGIGVASNHSGNVALFRGEAPEPVLSLRLGTVDEDRIYARPTAKGLLVTVVFNGRHCRIFRVSDNGKLLAHTEEQEHGRPPALALGRHFVDFHDTTLIVRNAKLASVSELDATIRPVTNGQSADGKYIAIADPHGGDMALFAITKAGKVSELERVCYADERRATKAKKSKKKLPYAPTRAHGAACIGFAHKPVISPPWTVPTGDFALPLIVRTAGGVGQGMAVRLSGDALAGLSIDRATYGDISATFAPDGDGLLAELPSVELIAGVQLPFHPTPKASEKEAAEVAMRGTHIELVLHGKAAGASRAMLRVEVSALGASSSPLKWMRPLIVE